ncbi:hypothetical protein T07_1536 [Trichinella nelsoni]|uniref:Uncharacterized protein n=1 Tax=Trichinella nelsoni TaxID=6336 RepID=A0A0V0S5V2_9BILA|nr:hypothetical protein T07_1536 [Trichinella nelsoni]
MQVQLKHKKQNIYVTANLEIIDQVKNFADCDNLLKKNQSSGTNSFARISKRPREGYFFLTIIIGLISTENE